MNPPTLYRRRIIPDECIKLTEDQILYQDNSVIVTKWHTIRPKKNLHHGMSCYFLQKGYKISKFYGHDGSLVCWYCDIVDYEYNSDTNTYVFRDLLADVLLYENGTMKVVDLDELAEALEKNLISPADIASALRKLDDLLKAVYSGEFARLQNFINQKETGE